MDCKEKAGTVRRDGETTMIDDQGTAWHIKMMDKDHVMMSTSPAFESPAIYRIRDFVQGPKSSLLDQNIAQWLEGGGTAEMETKKKDTTDAVDRRSATWEELKAARDLVYGWLRGLRYHFYSAEDCSYIDLDGGRVEFVLFTDRNRYSISVCPVIDDYHGYLGCLAKTRKPRAGETWPRGNDLPDGPLTREKFDDIMRSIVGYELVDIKRPVSKMIEERKARRVHNETVPI